LTASKPLDNSLNDKTNLITEKSAQNLKDSRVVAKTRNTAVVSQ
jgi:hypothetical protein